MDQRLPHVRVSDNVNSFNISHNYSIVNTETVIADETSQILQWLSPLEPRRRHQDVRNGRLDGVGEWLLQTNEFREWSAGEDGCAHSVLLCYGDPGVGKTHLCSLVIDSLCDQDGGEDITVTGLYCDFLARKQQATANMLGAILKQVVNTREIPAYIRQAYQDSKRHLGGRSPRLHDVIRFLKIAVASLSRVFICIDALDESPEMCQVDLLESLRDITRGSPNVRVFLTGRPQVRAGVEKYFPTAHVVPTSPRRGDIKRYLEMRLHMDTQPDAMDNCLREDIMKCIPETISQIFLLVSLNIEVLLGETTIHRRRKKLKEITKGQGVGDAYIATLDRIKAQKGDKARLGIETLMWISHSERALHVDELCHALGVEMGSADVNIENIPSIRTLLGCSLGLVSVDASLSTVRLVHFTLQEHLYANPTLFHSPHSMIAEVCLTYLNFRTIKNLSPTLFETSPSGAPFLQYASCYWGRHVKRETTESVRSLALELLRNYDEHISAQLLFTQNNPGTLLRSPLGFTGLHSVAFFDLDQIAPDLIQMKQFDINATDCMGRTALAWAARNGSLRALKWLLDQEHVNPNAVDPLGQSALLGAVERGQEAALKVLLNREDVDHNITDIEGLTPIFWAAKLGREGVLEILLDIGNSDPNYTDRSGLTPVIWAVTTRNEQLLKILLDREKVDPNIKDMRGRPAIWHAAWNGYEELVDILLDRGDLDINATTTRGRTPLFGASQKGHVSVVEMLLARDDVNPNAADNSGTTPLCHAAENGNDELVDLLLSREDINPNAANNSGRTPLICAVESNVDNCTRIVRILVMREDVDLNAADINGRTSLLLAVQNEDVGVVTALVEQEDIALNLIDPDGRTPLSWAAQIGNEEVVQLLLDRDDINPNIADDYGRTPLWYAADKGHEEATTALLSRDDTNPNTPDNDSQTPLFRAVENGDEEVAQLLLDREDVNPNTPDSPGRTPLHRAASLGFSGIVEILLGHEDICPDTADQRGRTPLQRASFHGHEDILAMLLAREDIDPNLPDNRGRTPLSLAAESANEGVIASLLEREDLDLQATDNDGNTPLSWARRSGNGRVVGLLLDRGGRTPFLSVGGRKRMRLGR